MKSFPKIQLPNESDIKKAINFLGLDIEDRLFTDCERNETSKTAYKIMKKRIGEH